MALIGDHLSTHEYEFPKFVDDDHTILWKSLGVTRETIAILFWLLKVLGVGLCSLPMRS